MINRIWTGGAGGRVAGLMLAGLLGGAGIGGAPAVAGTVYFIEIMPGFADGSIRRVNTDGTGYEFLISTGSGVRSLDVDPGSGHVYWTDVNVPVIRRARLDGTLQEDLVTTGLEFPSAIAVAPGVGGGVGAMFWGDQLSYTLSRANLDGSGATVLRSTAFHRGVAVDEPNGKVYWSTDISKFRGNIVRSNLDGSAVQTVITSIEMLFKPNSIALDLAAGKIYWTDYVVDVVRRANLDGTGLEDLFIVPGNFNPRGVALDLAAGKVYWGQDVDFDGSAGRLMRMDLDGARPEIVLNNVGLVNDLVVVQDACQADFNGDGTVNVQDFLAYLVAYSEGLPSADFTGDGLVTVQDFLAFLQAFSEGCA